MRVWPYVLLEALSNKSKVSVHLLKSNKNGYVYKF